MTPGETMPLLEPVHIKGFFWMFSYLEFLVCENRKNFKKVFEY